MYENSLKDSLCLVVSCSSSSLLLGMHPGQPWYDGLDSRVDDNLYY